MQRRAKDTKIWHHRGNDCGRTARKELHALSVTDLLVFGDRVQKLCVQFGIVLGQGLMAIVIDELHHRQEGQGLREAVPPLSVVNLYELVIPSFPAEGDKDDH